jgi:hypothetical protein
LCNSWRNESTRRRNMVIKEYGAIEGGMQTLERFAEYPAKMSV